LVSVGLIDMLRHPPVLMVGAALLALVAARTPAAESARTEALSHSGLPSILHDGNAGTSAAIPAVAVTTPGPPTEEQLAADSLYQFVLHHATTRYVSTATTRNLARWRGGKQSICPMTVGLASKDNAFVTARVRALAAFVGAPVQSDRECAVNVQILFTSNPKEGMDAVMKWATAPATFGIRYSGGKGDLLAYRGGHAIQGWYITTRGGARVLNTDVALVGLMYCPCGRRSPSATSASMGSGRVWGMVAGPVSASGWSS
jgi:hypothetical protein